MSSVVELSVGDESAYLILAVSQIVDTLRVSGGLSNTVVPAATVGLADQANALVSGMYKITFTG